MAPIDGPSPSRQTRLSGFLDSWRTPIPYHRKEFPHEPDREIHHVASHVFKNTGHVAAARGDPITERDLRPVAAEPDWQKQRQMWVQLGAKSSVPIPMGSDIDSAILDGFAILRP